MLNEQKRLKTPEENYEEAAMALAFYRLMQHDNITVKENSSEKEEMETRRIAEESTPRMLAFIEQQIKTHDRKNIRRQVIRVLQMVALFILVVNMLLNIAVAASTTMRAKVIAFLTEINESYMSVGYVETDLSMEVPEGWTANYYPTYIPDGYELCSVSSNGGVNEAEYANAQGNELEIRVCDIVAASRINTENTEISHATVQDMDATILKQTNYKEIDIIWAVGEHSFIVSGPDNETVMAVAESITLIQK